MHKKLKSFRPETQDRGYLGFPLRKEFGFFFYLQVAQILPTFKSICLSIQENMCKIDFQDGSHDDFSCFCSYQVSSQLGE